MRSRTASPLRPCRRREVSRSPCSVQTSAPSLHPTARSHGGFRLYDATAITRIRWIELLQSSGFSLHQIQSLLNAWHSTKYGPDAMASVRGIFQKRLAEARQAIARYQALAKELEGSLESQSLAAVM